MQVEILLLINSSNPKETIISYKSSHVEPISGNEKLIQHNFWILMMINHYDFGI